MKLYLCVARGDCLLGVSTLPRAAEPQYWPAWTSRDLTPEDWRVEVAEVRIGVAVKLMEHALDPRHDGHAAYKSILAHTTPKRIGM